MNVSYRWLQAILPGLECGAERLAEHLALRGAPVESITSPAAGLADIVVGRVVRAGRHPNADRLSLCVVDDGQGERQVVCGAPNVRAGACYPFAPVGASLPGGIRLKKSKIRGEVSEGMLCSAKELGLGTDHAGILEIPSDLTPGTPLVEALELDDATLDVEITANRGDLLSHLGVAREAVPLAAGPPTLPPVPGAPAFDAGWAEGRDEVEACGARIRIEAPDLCSRYLGAIIRGVRIAPSPPWLQARLRGAGARPINNVVDATNYVMLEMGQPLHAFDLSRLEGRAIVVRQAREGETRFTTLDGEERRLDPSMLMICDAERPVAVAGVMGGLDSEVDEDTTDVLLECALFDPPSIRATRRALNLSTDASYRFERGVDPEGMRGAVERAVALILATAGGRLEPQVLDVCPRPFEPAHVPVRMRRVERVLGVSFALEEVTELLEPLGFRAVEREAERVVFRVPGYRSRDVTREIDLIEEIARTHGYDAFPAKLGAYRPNTVPDDRHFALEDRLRAALVGRGFFEAQTPAFVPEGEGDVRVANPLNTREPYVRRDVMPSLVRRVAYNLARGNRDVRLFELATSFSRTASGEPPREEPHLAVAVHGRRRPPHWSLPDEPFDLWDLKGLLEELAERSWGGDARVEPAGSAPGFAEGTALALVRGDGTILGHGGQVAPGSLDVPAWAGAIWGLEVALPVPAPPPAVPVHHPLPQVPAVERDLALLLPEGVSAGAVHEMVVGSGVRHLEAVETFDVYQGDELPGGTRSVAYRLRFRAADRTLKDREVDRAVAAVVKRLKEELGVQQRT